LAPIQLISLAKSFGAKAGIATMIESPHSIPLKQPDM